MKQHHNRQLGLGQLAMMPAVAIGILWGGGMNDRASAETAIASAKPVLDSSISSYQTTTPVTGRMAIAGSDTMQPIMVKLASAFQQWHPGVKVGIQGGGPTRV